ncbi:PREDICTED: flocculation protein FLO11 [Populus euphratica]|uniref:Flocculation protein FLO11 n=1 Tax=Populus euphratica TaxID=75702 RepID=A0AAJ6TC44_POPEU|nr:PREDICTED: flocculation protein FLO11 [Populus euphratica]
MSGGGVRVSIPSNARKTIQNIKEIAGNHSDEEIYAMLKECSMDPNETAQKLLSQDPFHEVKRKRDRKKENAHNRESGDSRWRSGSQGRVSRGSRAIFSPRRASHDTGGGRNSAAGRDNGISHAVEKGTGSSLSASEEKSKETTASASLSAVVANGPTGVVSGNSSAIHASNLPTGSNQHEVASSPVGVNNVGKAASHIDVDKTPTIAFGTGDTCKESVPSSSNSSMSVAPASSSTVCFSLSDPVLIPSNELHPPGTVGAIKREVGIHQTAGESNAVIPSEKSASEIGLPFMQGKLPSKNQGVGKNQLSESSQPSSASIQGGSSGSRPSSNYSSRSQQLIGPQKVGSNKEWKPKSTNPNVAQESGTAGLSAISNIPPEASGHSQPSSGVFDSEEATAILQKLEELHLPQRQNVIIPHHIHVPESERTKLSFGSFDASFGVPSCHVSPPESDKISTPVSETSQVIEESVEEQAQSKQNTLVTAEEGNYPDHPQSPSHVPGKLSAEGDVSSNVVPDYESKQEAALLSGGQQYSVVHTSPSYSFGFVPPMLGSQIAPFENSESQARDVSRLPSFVVQQPFDPPSYYAQFYRSSADSDGHVSPFPAPGVASKYNGNVAVLPPHTSQSPQEGGNSLVLSTAGPTPLVTQPVGVMPTQQPVPVFRPPTGLHISHFPQNYIPYAPYFSPLYVPPPGIHQFLSNGAFPQQPQAGSVYPAPASAAAAGVKYALPQYKPGANTVNATHIGMPSGYGPYGSSPTGYNPNSAVTGGNTTTSDDLGASQFKENNVYITGQQSSEGSAVWIAAPGRDMSGLPASSLYNLPPQGQHVTSAPTQAAHGTFTNIYHPGQPVTAAAVHPLLQQSQAMGGAVDMVGPAANVYQQPQHQQINWPSNY